MNIKTKSPNQYFKKGIDRLGEFVCWHWLDQGIVGVSKCQILKLYSQYMFEVCHKNVKLESNYWKFCEKQVETSIKKDSKLFSKLIDTHFNSK